VFVFERTGTRWTFQQTLFPVELDSPFEGFGLPCALDGERLLIGARVLGPFTDGVAHLFLLHAGTWVLSASFPITSPNATFANQQPSLAIDGVWAIIGAPKADLNGTNSGAAHVIDADVLFADLDCDGIVGGSDLGILLLSWGACPLLQTCATDLDADGQTNGGDLGQCFSTGQP